MSNKKSTLLLSGAILFFFMASAVSPETKITIDESIQHQTIEGFGGCVYESGEFYDQQFTTKFWDDIIEDLGATMVRLRAHMDMSFMVKFVNHIKAKKKLDYDVKFIATYWSPPSSYKKNQKLAGCAKGVPCPDNIIIVDSIPAYAKYCVNQVKDLQSKTGVNLYALSFANEPYFSEPYASCVYTADPYIKTLKAVKSAFKASNLNTLIFGAEDMANSVGLGGSRGYDRSISKDPEALASLDRFAVHGYTNGVAPTDQNTSVAVWSSVGYVNKIVLKKPTWMTETSGFATDYNGALAYGASIMHGLKYGYLSAWVFWTFSNFKGDVGTFEIMEIKEKSKRYYVQKNFSRWIRPEAVMVECTGDTIPGVDGLNVATFIHAKQKTMTVVALNVSDKDHQISLNSKKLPSQFKKYITSSTKDCVLDQTVPANQAITIPAKSLVTLYGENYEPFVSNLSKPSVKSNLNHTNQLKTNQTVYTITGRKLSSGTIESLTKRKSSGIFLVSNSKEEKQVQFFSK